MKSLTLNKVLFLILTVFAASKANARQIRIAVIDTGMPNVTEAKLCKDGHRDFTGTGLQDRHGHGSHVIDTINQYITGAIKVTPMSKTKGSSVDYCVVVLKYYDDLMFINRDPKAPSPSARAFKEALDYASKLKIDIVNISGGGNEYDYQEYGFVEKLLNLGVTIVAAAGNEGPKQRQEGAAYSGYYPAMYDKRIVVVGSLGIDRKVASYSNVGKYVDVFEIGTGVIGATQNGAIAVMSGTSQATAIRSGKIARMMAKSKK